MMNLRKFIFMQTFLLILVSVFGMQEYAVFIEPVTDLFPDKLSCYGENYGKHYVAPISGCSSKYDCRRSAQALFNEVVKICDYCEETGEIEILCTQMLYGISKEELRPLKFWTLKKNLCFLVDLKEKGVDTSCFPIPVTYEKPESLHSGNTLVLTWPWHDKETNKIYSLGTRFVRVSNKDSSKTFCIKIFNSKNFTVLENFLPKKIARVCEKKISAKERISKFVELLKILANTNDGIIPYVWGGRSFTKKFEDEKYSKVKGKFFSCKINYWLRKKIKERPYVGFDCSSLVMNTTQLFGIPYFYKTSSVAFSCAPATESNSLRDGDIVVFNGHMFVIVDAKNSKMVDTTGYSTFLGRIRIIDLKNFLNDSEEREIDGKKLFELYKSKKPIWLFRPDGKVRKKIERFKIIDLRLLSDNS